VILATGGNGVGIRLKGGGTIVNEPGGGRITAAGGARPAAAPAQAIEDRERVGLAPHQLQYLAAEFLGLARGPRRSNWAARSTSGRSGAPAPGGGGRAGSSAQQHTGRSPLPQAQSAE
jgi:hypothetical protein